MKSLENPLRTAFASFLAAGLVSLLTGPVAALQVKQQPRVEPTAAVGNLAQARLVSRNWDFRAGLSRWTATGTAFSHQPTVGDNVSAYRVRFGRVGGNYFDVP